MANSESNSKQNVKSFLGKIKERGTSLLSHYSVVFYNFYQSEELNSNLSFYATQINIPGIKYIGNSIKYHGSTIYIPEGYEYGQEFSMTLLADDGLQNYVAMQRLAAGYMLTPDVTNREYWNDNMVVSNIQSGLRANIIYLADTFDKNMSEGKVQPNSLIIKLYGIKITDVSGLTFATNSSELATFTISGNMIYFAYDMTNKYLQELVAKEKEVYNQAIKSKEDADAKYAKLQDVRKKRKEEIDAAEKKVDDAKKEYVKALQDLAKYEKKINEEGMDSLTPEEREAFETALQVRDEKHDAYVAEKTNLKNTIKEQNKKQQQATNEYKVAAEKAAADVGEANALKAEVDNQRKAAQDSATTSTAVSKQNKEVMEADIDLQKAKKDTLVAQTKLDALKNEAATYEKTVEASKGKLSTREQKKIEAKKKSLERQIKGAEKQVKAAQAYEKDCADKKNTAQEAKQEIENGERAPVEAKITPPAAHKVPKADEDPAKETVENAARKS